MPKVFKTNQADKALSKLPPKIREQIISQIVDLQTSPFLHKYKKLKGVPNAYRLRVNDYRILYTFQSDIDVITIYRIAHRKEVYKQ